VSDRLSYEERVAVTQKVFRLFADWEVSLEDMPRLLGLPSGLKRRELNRYRLGTPLEEGSEAYARIGLFLEIDNALHKLFPHSSLSASLWITTPRLRFGSETPLALMLRKGLEGIRMVRDALHHPQDW